jgi:signal transduction histidine kinase
MSDSDLLARLAQHRTLGGAPPEELAWLVAHGHLRHYNLGEQVALKGQAIEGLYVVLAGRFAIYVDRGLGPRKVLEWRGGDVSGHLPYSRMTGPPGNTIIDEPTDLLFVDRAHFPELTRECPTITAKLVHVMVDRARTFTSSDLQDEKMMSLGRMSAQLAHELNNPASAATRSARLLNEALTEAEDAAAALGAARLTQTQLDAIDRMRTACVEAGSTALTPIERADREEALASWLDAHGVDSEAASSLLDSQVTIDTLDTLASAVQGPHLQAAIRSIAAGCTSRTLAAEIHRATSRIHELVGAMKRFSYMDRQQAPDAIELSQSLRDTVALLLPKARKKSVGVKVDIQNDLPRVQAIGSDLGQIWMNLIDNAVDAAPEAGRVEISAVRELNSVVVRIVDNGPGIPADIRERIFDQFFTTKPVGQGTGLGLDLARRLARRNDSDIEVDSQPGRTEFRVALPVATEQGAVLHGQASHPGN